jgi:hypothetical protein
VDCAQERRERVRKLQEEKKLLAEKAATRKVISARCSREHFDRDKAKRKATVQTHFNRGGMAVGGPNATGIYDVEQLWRGRRGASTRFSRRHRDHHSLL